MEAKIVKATASSDNTQQTTIPEYLKMVLFMCFIPGIYLIGKFVSQLF